MRGWLDSDSPHRDTVQRERTGLVSFGDRSQAGGLVRSSPSLNLNCNWRINSEVSLAVKSPAGRGAQHRLRRRSHNACTGVNRRQNLTNDN